MSGLALSPSWGLLLCVTETLILAYVALISWADSQGLFPRLQNVGAFKTVTLVPTDATCGLPDRSRFCHSSVGTQRLCVQDCPHRCVIEKTAHGQIVFKLTVSEEEATFYHRAVNGLQPPIKVMTLGRTLVKERIHLSVQVHQTKISFFVNGLEEDGTALDSQTLSGSVIDFASGATRIGQSFNGLEQFIGRMQDFQLYQEALTNREIGAIFAGALPTLHVQPLCRCLGSHPRAHPLRQLSCIPNAAEHTTGDRVSRLHPEAHPLSFANYDDVGTAWVSHVFTNITQLHQGVTVSLDLENGQYQVFYVIVQFLSPQPTAVRIHRKKEDSLDWEDGQYFARNCSVFGMENNGRLENSDSVNCLQLADFTPYSGGNITFSLLAPGPNSRPGYNEFYNFQSLQVFVKATQVRLHLHGQYYTTETPASLGHRYYMVSEITVTGRCHCHGHTDSWDTTSQPYRCLCSKESFTRGLQCDRCLPLYNDKPFRPGDQVHALGCKSCQCHGHARSCHYDISEDPFPSDPHRGGGGVCDDCQHNTTGRNCELYKEHFSRPVGADASAPDVCQPCDCDPAGTGNGSLLCDQMGGQCDCKRRASGRRCNQCQDGFFKLQAPDPDGCSPCHCNTSGTQDGDITCHPRSGQCTCKANVTGLRCHRCHPGFKFLRSFPDGGCKPCRCNPFGSMSELCDPLSGQCECQAHARGLVCDTCREHFYGLDLTGCRACGCHPAGSLPGTACDTGTGQCHCQPGVAGRQCDGCSEGSFYLRQNSSFLCLPCACDQTGTVNGSLPCDQSTGQCPCKAGVTGLRCGQCGPHRYSLTAGDLQGCWPCECDSSGTFPGTVCDPSNGQCPCLPRRQGRRCDRCQRGFYVSPGSATGCLPCSCHPSGAAHHICNSRTGQCACQDASTSGLSCDRCGDLYFGFDPQTGRCQPCNCHLSGALNETCHLVTGRCFCKRFVTGSTCDTCVPGASYLDASNPWGCSKTPSQQPPPRGQVQSSSAIHLSRSPPDYPNAHRLAYSLFRDGSEIYTTEDQYPYDIQGFLDTALSPYTSYSYSMETSNVQGSTRSAAVAYRTRPGVPEGTLNLSYVPPVGSDSVTLTWTAASSPAGPIEQYLLSCLPFDDTQPCAPQEGLGTSATVRNLLPFTEYSPPVTLTTAQAPPRARGPPAVGTISSTELRVEWAPPMEPNGIIVRYELYMRRLRSDGEPTSPESRVFESSGWLSPRPLAESANEKALAPPPAATTIQGLKPYTTYEFRVWAANMAGSVSSPWASGQTGESEPLSMAPPSVSLLSPHALNVSWEKPADNVTRGDIVGYEVNMISELSPQQPAPVVCSQVLARTDAQQLSCTVSGLKPYSTYNFTVSLCNPAGCVASASAAGRTLPAAPAQLRPPLVEGLSGPAARARWLPPAEPNGPPPLCQLERGETSLPAPGARAEKGVRFPGHGHYTFPSSTLPVHTGFTGIKASFRTQVPEGLLVFAVFPGNQEEYLSLQLKHGCLYFLFDPQGSSVEVTTTNDGGKQYSDGRWHDIVAVRHRTSGWITVDGQYTGFLELDPSTFCGGMDFEISFKFRTDQLNGLLLFIYNRDRPDFLAVELKSGTLSLRLHASLAFTRLDLWLGLSYRDGTWNTVTVRKGGALVSTGLNDLTERVSQPRAGPLAVDSPVYLGGLPLELQDSHAHLGLAPGFGGFLRDVAFEHGKALCLASVFLGAVRVHLDGCLPGGSAVSCRGDDSILAYRGPEPSARDQGLQPFTDYLHRVVALHEEGSVWSDWSRGRTTGAAPRSVLAPSRVLSIKGSSVEVTWDEPVEVRGVVEKYILRACPVGGGPGPPRPPCATTSELAQTSNLTGVLTGLLPFRSYGLTLAACTLAGCTGSSRALNISTPQEAPQEVQAPVAQSLPSSLLLSWNPPKKPNGIITQYSLYMDGMRIYSGIGEKYTATDLVAFSPHQFLLRACTRGGCTNSSLAALYTAQLPPEHVKPPMLTVLDSRTVYARWKQPGRLNGILEHYLLYISNHTRDFTIWDVIYNSTELFQDHTLQFLLPGTRYLLKLGACTAGGCTVSESTEARTEDCSPEGVPAPKVDSDSPHSFTISWTEPQRPNGVITHYGLYLDGLLVHSSSERRCHANGLAPGSRHSFRGQACRARGCALGPLVENRTLEAPPEGAVGVSVKTEGSRRAQLRWEGPSQPSGLLTYTVLLTGMFYADQAASNYTLLNGTRLVHRGEESSLWVPIDRLVPFTNYKAEVDAANTRGSLTSEPTAVVMPPGAPDGVLPPRLTAAAPTSLQVAWSTPARNNAPGSARYQLQMRPGPSTPALLELFSSPSASLSHEVRDLQPHTEYAFRAVASNGFGSALSPWTLFMTAEDRPGPVDPPILLAVDPRALSVTWQRPAQPNGVLMRYHLCQGSQLLLTAPADATNRTVTRLRPHTAYTFRVEACTAAGCSRSPPSQPVRTPPAAPEGILSPELFSDDTPTSVILSWQAPTRPNVTLQRRVPGEGGATALVMLPDNGSTRRMDQTPALRPWMRYGYRVLMGTLGGGTSSSAWANMTTRPSRPAGVQPPTAAEVTWKPPLIQNGDMLSYEIRMLDPRVTMTNVTPAALSHVISGLTPFTEYSVSIVACSGGRGHVGGCTESSPTHAATPPSPPQGVQPLSEVPLGESNAAVSWQPPFRPNGPDLRYELLRRKIRQPLASYPPEDLNRWHNIYSGTQRFYEDKGLSRFTTYVYKVFVHNSAGFTPSQEATVTTLAGPPQRGARGSVTALNHSALDVRWDKPTFQDLQGDVEYYTLFWSSATSNESLKILPDVNAHVIGHLSPNTEYRILISVFNGIHSIASDALHATTRDAEPRGMPPPEVVIVNSTAVRVIWSPPSSPNGAVTGYSVYVNSRLHGAGMDVAGSLLLPGLSPFTAYDIQVEVCTKYACAKSNGTQVTTTEDTPRNMPAATIHSITSRSLRIDWTSPGKPNGIVLGKSWAPCPKTQKAHGGELCKAVICQKPEPTCGHRCYDPEAKVCCAGVLHDAQPGHHCCEDKYIPLDRNSMGVCCGGRIQPARPEHRCCVGYYVHVLPGMSCCGQDYVSVAETRCCSASSGASRPHARKNGWGPVKCCETALIPESQACCNGAGYDPLAYVCFDKAPTGTGATDTPEACGTVCPESVVATAHCGRCDFNSTSHVCTVTRGSRSSMEKAPVEEACSSAEERVHTGSADAFSFTDANLEPYTTYEYRISAWNGCGRGFSGAVRAIMKEDMPRGVSPPQWVRTGHPEDGIVLTWKEPLQPNGHVVDYILLRDGAEYYRGRSLTFSDTTGIQPSQEHSDQLKACTVAGCAPSGEVAVTTPQGVPQSVPPPRVAAPRADALHLSWDAPEKPNGVVKEYQLLRQVGKGLIHADTTDRREHTVAGLQPYTSYSFALTACTSAGCASSEPFLGQTPQAAPRGMWATPRHVIINSTAVALYWSPPERPNGLVSQYQLFHNGTSIFQGGSEDLHFTDQSLAPNSRYRYMLEATTGGGSSVSDAYLVQTPLLTPEDIPPPHNITVSGPYSVFVAWTPPGILIPQVPVEYSVLLNAGSVAPVTSAVGQRQSTLLGNLAPFTPYEIRIQACQNGSCGVSSGTFVRTSEAAPMDLSPPVLRALGSACIDVTWVPPRKPNGVVTRYFIHRRPAGSEEDPALVCVWSEGAFRFTDAAGALRPFTPYEYQVRARNSGGSGASLWTSARTLEAPPQDLPAPRARATGAHSVLLTWTEPGSPNGIVSQYHVVYQERPEDPTFSMAPVRTFTVAVCAVNSAGRAPSSWAQCKTGPAPPEGLTAPSFHAVSSTQAVANISAPGKPNGIVSLYKLISNSTDGAELVLSEGPAAQLRTLPAPPARLAAPLVQALASRTASFLWGPPLSPNVIIKSYELQLHPACPHHSDAPRTPSGTQTRYRGPGPSAGLGGLRPHTPDGLRAVAHSQETSAASQWIHFTTRSQPPQYQAPISVTSNRTAVCVRWAGSFLPPGPLRAFELADRGWRLYRGLATALCVPSAGARAFLFQVTCTTAEGSARTPPIQHHPSAGLGPAGLEPPTSGGQKGPGGRGAEFYGELWFLALMAALGLILLAIFLSLALQRKIRREPFLRERPPLVPAHKRAPPRGACPPGEAHTGDSVADVSDATSNVTLKSYTMHFEGLASTKIPGSGARVSLRSNHSISVVRVPGRSRSQSQSQSPAGQASPASLHRSVSQLLGLPHKPGPVDGSLWDTILGHDSGLFLDEEDLMDAIKGFSSVTKEQTTFTDTQL